jgi:GGDEF domain-containing protein
MVVNYDNPKSAAFILVSVDSVNSITAAPDDGRALLLDEIATRLREVIRKSDVVGVLSIDQIGIVLPYFRSDGARILKSKILALSSLPIIIPDGQFDVTLSTTSVLFPDQDLTSAEIIKRAQATLTYNKTTKVDPLELTRPMKVQGRAGHLSARQ